ncbi:hypothetical protein BAU15_00790 [Enterococcus sp. JM4C]|uniref:glycosyltransferase family 2 protein n=1 Tax=Candidatus Enterococcus huntleyi TaxID=1857217 RepID=UPI001379B5CC|nr:glycosyltransferase family 2 protein [Enterococcus sp. JM4C]KAF1299214.1 hypothetical protein BAU15_00790 [Enterococcus sp. JM4C]
MKNRKVINSLLCLISTVFLCAIFYYFFIKNAYSPYLAIIWVVNGLALLVYAYSYTFRWLPKDLRLDKYKEARVIGLIPAFNEEPELLEQTIYSILNQSYEVDAVHVVDDGSVPAVVPFDHPKVIWHRQENKGKRHAQACALEKINPETVDFILTVDSDSVLEEDALEKLLLSFEKDDEVMGCTGFVITKNFRKNLITRISDLNIGIACIVTRPSRSLTGSLETTSGALSLYKKEILFDNLPHYLSSGTYSDDRQLCLYSAIEGKAIGIQEAVVYSDMPEKVSGLLKQRQRWGKGGWKYFPFQVTNLSYVDLIFPFLGMVQWLAAPVFLVAVVVSLFVQQYSFIIIYLLVRLVIRYIEAAMYLLGSSHMNPLEKFLTWLLITPIEMLLTSFVLVFVKYHSLITIGEEGWLTRGNK